MNKTLKSYFYWTYPRGHLHYDVMVTLILLFIFVTPHLWNYGAKPTVAAGLTHPIQIIGDGKYGVVITMSADDVAIPANADTNEVRRVLRQAIEPVAGDAVNVEHWETAADADGHIFWKIWAHR